MFTIPDMLTHVILQRTKYLAASKTLNQLLDMEVIPIVNENDALSVRRACELPVTLKRSADVQIGL
jgi:hypothetical protein